MNRKVAWILVIGAFLLCPLSVGCGAITPKQPTPTPVPLAIAERRTLHRVERIDLINVFMVRGQVVPSRQQELYFKASGRVNRVTAQKGDTVKKGDLLAELEMEDLLKQVQQAQIDLEGAQAKLAETERAAKYAIARAQHQVNMQQIQVELARARLKDAEQQLKISEITLEKARIARERAQAAYDKIAWEPGAAGTPQAMALQQADLDYQAAQARYAQDKNSKVTYELQLKLAEENLALAQLALEEVSEGISLAQKQAVDRAQIALDRLNAQVQERQIVAPFDGVLLMGSVKPGDMVQAFSVVFVIGDPTELVIAVSESADSRLARLKGDEEITFTTYQHQNEPVGAKLLTRFYPVENAEEKQSTYTYFSMDKTWPDLQPGDPVEIRIVLERREDVLAVPINTVRHFLNRAFVVVQDGDLQKRVDVKVGITTDTWAEVEGDLQEGDLVVAP